MRARSANRNLLCETNMGEKRIQAFQGHYMESTQHLKPAIIRSQTKLAIEETSVLRGILRDVAVLPVIILTFVTPFASAALLHHSR